MVDTSDLVAFAEVAEMPNILGHNSESLHAEVKGPGTDLFGILGPLFDLLLPGNASLQVSLSDIDFGELDLALLEPELVLSISIGINDSDC